MCSCVRIISDIGKLIGKEPKRSKHIQNTNPEQLRTQKAKFKKMNLEGTRQF
jgi:hypothetical protein